MGGKGLDADGRLDDALVAGTAADGTEGVSPAASSSSQPALTALARMRVPSLEEARHFTRNLWWDGRLPVSQLTSSAASVRNVYKFEELALLLLGPDGIEHPLADRSKLVLLEVDPAALRTWVREQVEDLELADALDEMLAGAHSRHEGMVAIRRCLGRRWQQYRRALGVAAEDGQDAEGAAVPEAVPAAGAVAAPARVPLPPEGLARDFPLLAPRRTGAPPDAGDAAVQAPPDAAGSSSGGSASARMEEGLGPGAGVYLDNASTTQKPKAVLDAVRAYYESANGNPYRGVYPLSRYAEQLYEGARRQVAHFINAAHAEEVIFTGGTTASLNQLAWAYGMSGLGERNNIVLPLSEHHSNLVPWQRVARATGARIVYLHPGEDGRISAGQVRSVVDGDTKIVALAHASNVFGVQNPVAEISGIAHEAGAVLVLDAAQTVAHIPLDVQALDVDFMAFSGHKAYAPMGVGVLYGKRPLLEKLDPALSGGGMVRTVDEGRATWAPLPRKLEAGTPNVGGAVGLAQALGYLESLGMEEVHAHEARLVARALEGFKGVPGVKIYGDADASSRCGLVSFNVGAVHAEDIAWRMARHGVSLKSGNHCAQPLMRYLGVTSTCRMSVGVANSESDIDRFIGALHATLRDIGNFVMSYAGL